MIRFAKFVFVGMTNTIAYFLVANLFVYGLGVKRNIAAFGAYALLVPVSFLAHRQITFRSKGSAVREGTKFCVMQAVCIGVIAAVNAEMNSLPQSASWIGFGIISVLIPLFNFVAMQLWVFAVSRGQ